MNYLHHMKVTHRDLKSKSGEQFVIFVECNSSGVCVSEMPYYFTWLPEMLSLRKLGSILLLLEPGRSVDQSGQV